MTTQPQHSAASLGLEEWERFCVEAIGGAGSVSVEARLLLPLQLQRKVELSCGCQQHALLDILELAAQQLHQKPLARATRHATQLAQTTVLMAVVEHVAVAGQHVCVCSAWDSARADAAADDLANILPGHWLQAAQLAAQHLAAEAAVAAAAAAARHGDRAAAAGSLGAASGAAARPGSADAAAAAAAAAPAPTPTSMDAEVGGAGLGAAAAAAAPPAADSGGGSSARAGPDVSADDTAIAAAAAAAAATHHLPPAGKPPPRTKRCRCGTQLKTAHRKCSTCDTMQPRGKRSRSLEDARAVKHRDMWPGGDPKAPGAPPGASNQQQTSNLSKAMDKLMGCPEMVALTKEHGVQVSVIATGVVSSTLLARSTTPESEYHSSKFVVSDYRVPGHHRQCLVSVARHTSGIEADLQDIGAEQARTMRTAPTSTPAGFVMAGFKTYLQAKHHGVSAQFRQAALQQAAAAAASSAALVGGLGPFSGAPGGAFQQAAAATAAAASSAAGGGPPGLPLPVGAPGGGGALDPNSSVRSGLMGLGPFSGAPGSSHGGAFQQAAAAASGAAVVGPLALRAAGALSGSGDPDGAAGTFGNGCGSDAAAAAENGGDPVAVALRLAARQRGMRLFRQAALRVLLPVPDFAEFYNTTVQSCWGRQVVLCGEPAASQFVGGGRRVGGIRAAVFLTEALMHTRRAAFVDVDAALSPEQMAAVWTFLDE